MKVTTDFFILAQSATVDKFTNILTIGGVIEGATAPTFPIVMSGLVAVARFTITKSGTNTGAKFIFKVMAPDGSEKEVKHEKGTEFEIGFKSNEETQKCGLILNLILEISQTGRHIVNVYYKNDIIASQDILISKEE